MNGILSAPSPCGEGWDEANKKNIPIHLSSVAKQSPPGVHQTIYIALKIQQLLTQYSATKALLYQLTF